MRFYVGTSYKIKTKVLIKLLIGLGIIILGVLGLDRVNAWSNVSLTNSTFSNGKNVYLSSGDDFTEEQTDNVSIYFDNGSYGKSVYFGTSSSSKDNKFVFAKSNGLATSNYYYNGRISSYSTMETSRTNFSCSDTSSNTSINFEFPIYIDNYKNDLAFFNQSSTKDLFRLTMTAISGDNLYTTTCSHSSLSGSDNGSYYLVTCNNVFRGSTSNPVTSYRFTFLNMVPFNDRYSSSSESKGIVYFFEFGNRQFSFTRTYDINYQLRYECNDEEPIIDNPGGGDDDPAGLNDIYDRIKEHYVDNPTGIDTNDMVDMPAGFSDLLNLPFALIQGVINTSSACEPYELDLSGLLNLNGGNNHYSIELPCMRTFLSNLFGNWYNIFDILICFYLFYDISMHIISLITAVIQGQDLFTYFFKSSNSKAYPDNYTGGEH